MVNVTPLAASPALSGIGLWGRGRRAVGGQQGPPEQTRGAAQGAGVLGAVLGDRQARGASRRPCHPGAAGPHAPSILSLGDIPQTQSHCLPSALDPSHFSEAPSRSLLPAPPGHVSPENTLGPQSPEASPSPGRPASESSTFLAQQVWGPSSGCLLTLSFFFFFFFF